MLAGLVQNGSQLYIGSREMHWGLLGVTIAMLSALKDATSEVFSDAQSQEMLAGLVQNGPQLYIDSREIHWGLHRITIAMLSSLKSAASEMISDMLVLLGGLESSSRVPLGARSRKM